MPASEARCVGAIYPDRGRPRRSRAVYESLNASRRAAHRMGHDARTICCTSRTRTYARLSQETFFEQYLDAFDDPWWRQLIGRGVQRPRVDVFVDYWLEAQTGTSVAVRRVFREFQHYVDRRDDRLEETMEQLLDDARYFMESETVESGATGREALFHERRLAMGAGAVWPLLLKLRHLDADPDDREACFVALESYLVRRLIAGYQARSYDQVALELIEALSEQAQIPKGPSKAIRTHLLSYSENANLWPNDAVTIQAVSQRNLALYARRLVLAALERNLITSMAGNQRVPAGLHVEHLLPQGWGPQEWPLPSGIDPEQAEEGRSQALATLGNLTLLNARLNSSVSNRAWTVKREKIRQSDNLFLNKRLLEEASDCSDSSGSRGLAISSLLMPTRAPSRSGSRAQRRMCRRPGSRPGSGLLECDAAAELRQGRLSRSPSSPGLYGPSWQVQVAAGRVLAPCGDRCGSL